jgi:hypothetical protein
VSIAAPGAIWRIIEALRRPIDRPIGPIHLTTADADWLQTLLLSIAAEHKPREGYPGDATKINAYVWVALDVAMRLSKSNPMKVVCDAVAQEWGIKERQVERWEAKARETAKQLLSTGNEATLARMVQYQRDAFLKKATKKAASR